MVKTLASEAGIGFTRQSSDRKEGEGLRQLAPAQVDEIVAAVVRP